MCTHIDRGKTIEKGQEKWKTANSAPGPIWPVLPAEEPRKAEVTARVSSRN